jgi:hypothetical protein
MAAVPCCDCLQGLPVPELTPFRFTRQMQGVLQPHDPSSTIQPSLAAALEVCRLHQEVGEGNLCWEVLGGVGGLGGVKPGDVRLLHIQFAQCEGGCCLDVWAKCQTYRDAPCSRCVPTQTAGTPAGAA